MYNHETFTPPPSSPSLLNLPDMPIERAPFSKARLKNPSEKRP